MNKLRQRLQYPQKGFTIVELMVVLIIIAIMAAIAIPSYRQYAVKNAEDEAKAQMQQIQLELERWRASALSYKGFKPKIGLDSSGNPIYGYDNAPTNTDIKVPLGSDTNHRYTITLVDGSKLNTLAQPKSSTIDNSVGRSWRMVAIPNTNGIVGYRGKAFIMDSTGVRCQANYRETSKAEIEKAKTEEDKNCSSDDFKETW